MNLLSLRHSLKSLPLLVAVAFALLVPAVLMLVSPQPAGAASSPLVSIATDDEYPDWCDEEQWTDWVEDDCDYVEDPPPPPPPPPPPAPPADDPGDDFNQSPGDDWDPGWNPPDDPRWPKTPGGAVARLASDDRTAIAPKRAPRIVKDLIHAANRITRKPYKWGGGHARLTDRGYDCSGATSFVLRSVGLVNGSMVSGGYKAWGVKGAGRWVNVYANNGHVFMVIAGLRFDTSGAGESGPRWRTEARFTKGFKLRHPRKL